MLVWWGKFKNQKANSRTQCPWVKKMIHGRRGVLGTLSVSGISSCIAYVTAFTPESFQGGTDQVIIWLVSRCLKKCLKRSFIEMREQYNFSDMKCILVCLKSNTNIFDNYEGYYWPFAECFIHDLKNRSIVFCCDTKYLQFFHGRNLFNQKYTKILN